MKRAISIILALVLCLFLCACGSKDAPSGKYYSKDFDGAYYEFTNNDTCYLRFDDGEEKYYCEYVYTIIEDDDGVFTILLADTSSDAYSELLYTPYSDYIWDPEFGGFEKD